MKPLLKVMLILGLIFASTFILGRAFGILTAENIKLWLEWANTAHLGLLAGIVILLLFLDLFIAVPTLTITILSGYFLGPVFGALAALSGMSLAAFSGYVISRMWGERPVRFLIKDQLERQTMMETFHNNGPLMIILARAVPILPEVTACMAGVTQMRFIRYVFYFFISTIPYVLIATYAGSISSVENPKPAIFAALLICSILWSAWYFSKLKKAA